MSDKQTPGVTASKRNPIARSFGAGINTTQVIAPAKGKGAIKRLKHRKREIEYDEF